MKRIDPEKYIDGVLAGDRRILSKTITLIESALPAHREIARKVLDALIIHSGDSVRVGISGVPGAGKSTFIESLGRVLVEKGHLVAVLAVDPSSSKSGGSIMADKTRMERLAAESNAFIRPSPSGGTLGGVARKTRETMLICEAAGFDVIIVETVGVGQSESAVASMVDFFLVLMITGGGNELQGIKRGILELVDAIAINKADGENRDKAKKAAQMYSAALRLLRPGPSVWTPPVLTCSALESTGIGEVWQTILDHRKALGDSGELERRRLKQASDWMWFLIDEGLREGFLNNPEVKKRLSHIIQSVEKGTRTSTQAADELLSVFYH